MIPDKAFKLALGYLARQPKTISQMQRYLTGKSVDPDLVEKIISRLADMNYLDDRAYARQFIDHRIRFKPKSTFALEYELRAKGIDPGLAREMLLPYDDSELAWAAVKSRKDRWRHLDQETCKKKLMGHLRYRGFDYGASVSAWERFLTAPE